MKARLFATFPLAIAIGLCAGAPAFAQNAMPASSSTAMSQHKDAMKGSMHGHGTMMKKDAMQNGTMKHAAMHHGAMMKKDDSMKMKQAASAPANSGG